MDKWTETGNVVLYLRAMFLAARRRNMYNTWLT